VRNFGNVNKYLDVLAKDVYPQPADEKHTLWAIESILEFVRNSKDVGSVIDLGCGEAFCQQPFENYGIEYTGVCLGEDYEVAMKNGKNVLSCDFSFLPFEDQSYDMLYSRHSLEHSPMPLLTLMEWYRVSRKYVALVLPSPQHWGYKGKNHYFVLNKEQWENLFDVAGFYISYQNDKRYKMSPTEGDSDVEIEYWFLLEKRKK
jgi:ubiquinone/menaquinone biosynthesis C-methylase UbiE